LIAFTAACGSDFYIFANRGSDHSVASLEGEVTRGLLVSKHVSLPSSVVHAGIELVFISCSKFPIRHPAMDPWQQLEGG
jgi:hypothetical protein